MKLRYLSVAMLVALMSALVFVPAGAHAAPLAKKHNKVRNVKAKAKVGDATVNVTRFSVNQAGKLVASGNVTHATKGELGTFSDVLVTVKASSSVGAQRTGDSFAIKQATCEILTLTLGPIHLDLLGLVIETSEINLVITGETGGGNLLGNLLCAIAGLLDQPNALADLLNRILALLGGRLTGGSALTGAMPITISSFASKNGQLVANFFVNRADGGQAGPFVARAQLHDPADDRCDILYLELGPIDINLLGLRIQLHGATPEDPIVIHIYADPGPGNLLGNLLCAIVGLLDRNASAAAVAAKLNQVLAATD